MSNIRVILTYIRIGKLVREGWRLALVTGRWGKVIGERRVNDKDDRGMIGSHHASCAWR